MWTQNLDLRNNEQELKQLLLDYYNIVCSVSEGVQRFGRLQMKVFLLWVAILGQSKLSWFKWKTYILTKHYETSIWSEIELFSQKNSI